MEELRKLLMEKYDTSITITKVDVPQVQKNNSNSESKRLTGNKRFISRNYLEAFNLYNESICLAKPKSEMLAIAYANRSAVYFKLKEYKCCLVSIRLAKETGAYPVNLLPKLDKRMNDCLLQQDDEVINEYTYFLNLSYPAHPKIPGLIKALTLNENHKSIITNQDLNIGDVIEIQKSYASLISDKYRFQRCNYCLSQNKFNLIPCDNCTNVMFCNVECYKKANENYHQIECPMLETIRKSNATVFASRVLMKALKALGSVDNLRDFIKTNENCQFNEFEHNWKNPSAIEEYRRFYHEYRNEDDDGHSVELLLLHEYYLRCTVLKDMFVTQKDKKMLYELLMHHVHILISSKTRLFGDSCVHQPAQCFFPFSKFIEHSCNPNCYYEFFNDRRVLVVLRPVKKNQPITVSYIGDSFFDCPKQERALNLQFTGVNDCKCDACTNDYPVAEDLNKKYIPTIDHLLSGNKLRDLYVCIDYHRKYEQHFPCVELLMATRKFDEIMTHFRPKGYEDIIKMQSK